MTEPTHLTLEARRVDPDRPMTTALAELNQAQAWAFAQLLKRLSWPELRACAIDDAEAYDARDAVAKLQRAFAEAGIDPR